MPPAAPGTLSTPRATAAMNVSLSSIQPGCAWFMPLHPVQGAPGPLVPGLQALAPGSALQVTRGLAVISQAWDPNPTDQKASLLGHAPLRLSVGAPLSRLCAPFNPLPSSSPTTNAHRSPVELFLHTCPREMETRPRTDWHTNVHSIWCHKCPKLETIHVPIT